MIKTKGSTCLKLHSFISRCGISIPKYWICLSFKGCVLQLNPHLFVFGLHSLVLVSNSLSCQHKYGTVDQPLYFLLARNKIECIVSFFRHLKIKALDASQPFNYEFKRSEYLEKNSLLKIGIVGFGNFGQFLAKTLIKQGHRVLAHS